MIHATTHPLTAEELMAFCDGELSNEESQAAEAHLAECRECAETVRQFRETSQTLGEWSAPPVSKRIERAVEEQLQGANSRARGPGLERSLRPCRQAALETLGTWRSERRSRDDADCGDRYFSSAQPAAARVYAEPACFSDDGRADLRSVARQRWRGPATVTRSRWE